MEIVVDRRIRHWWVFLLRGLVFVFVGIYMVATPASSFAALGFLFGLIIFLAGLVEMLHVVRERKAHNRSWHLGLGIIDIILGATLMSHLTASEVILRIIVGLWFVFRGISLFSFSKVTSDSWAIKAGAILTFVFGLLIMFDSVIGTLTIVLWTGIAFIITGLFNLYLSYKMKNLI